MTEVFDVDSPCLEGDIESALQNLAYTGRYEQSARFRMCVKDTRTSGVSYMTVQGSQRLPGQIVQVDMERQHLICLNRDNSEKVKPGRPGYWFHRKITCDDYKIQ